MPRGVLRCVRSKRFWRYASVVWFFRAGRIVAGFALAAAVVGCGGQSIDVCKAARGGDPEHPVHLADSTDNGTDLPSRVAAPALPVLTVAADGIYLDHRPLLASWPKARCEKLARTLARRDQPSVAREQLVVPLDHWKLPTWAEADPDAIRPLWHALQWTHQHVERDMPKTGQGLMLRIDRDAPFRLVARVAASVPTAFSDSNDAFPVRVAQGVEKVAYGGERGSRGYRGPCNWFETIVELHEPGVSILLCDDALRPAGDACQCVLDSRTRPWDAVLRSILAVDAECRPPERLAITAPGGMRWSQLIAGNSRLKSVGIRAKNLRWFFWPSAPKCEVDTPASRLRALTASCAPPGDAEFDNKQDFDEKVAELRRAAAH